VDGNLSTTELGGLVGQFHQVFTGVFILKVSVKLFGGFGQVAPIYRAL